MIIVIIVMIVIIPVIIPVILSDSSNNSSHSNNTLLLLLVLGSNVKKRTRASRLALALAQELATREGVSLPGMQALVAQAEVALSSPPPTILAPMISAPPPALPPPPMGFPAASSTALAEPGLGVPRPAFADDPHAEMRPWTNGGGLWPYCTACGCWSDGAHLSGNRFGRRRVARTLV